MLCSLYTGELVLLSWTEFLVVIGIYTLNKTSFGFGFIFLILKKFFFSNLRFHLPNCTLSKHFKAKKEEMNLRVKRAMRIQTGILLTILFLKRNIVVSFLSVV